jgi:hypothetical protein
VSTAVGMLLSGYPGGMKPSGCPGGLFLRRRYTTKEE